MRVVPIPALADNYLFALADPATQTAALVDPGEERPALDFLERESLRLDAVLITHHHRDHVGGVSALARRHPGLRVVGPRHGRPRIAGLTEEVGDGDIVALFDRTVRVLGVPGHTLDHLAYFVPDGAGAGDLFSGDTVFGGTIGHLFEGTPDTMYASLLKIRALGPATRLWCGHEYTLEYVREAARFDPQNALLAERLRRLESEAAAGRPTLPLLLAEECQTNPFFRWDDPALVERLGEAPGLPTFRRLCELL